MRLQVRLLGGFAIQCDEAPVTPIGAPRLQSLLAYLLLHAGTAVARSHVAFVFWPDATEAAARNNLRQALHQLRELLPQLDTCLHIDAEAIQWSGSDEWQIDVHEFERELGEAEQVRRTAGDWLEPLETAAR